MSDRAMLFSKVPVVGPIAPGKCTVTFRKHSQVRTLKIIVNG